MHTIAILCVHIISSTLILHTLNHPLLLLSAGAGDGGDVQSATDWCALVRPAIPVLDGHESLRCPQTQNTGARCRRCCTCFMYIAHVYA